MNQQRRPTAKLKAALFDTSKLNAEYDELKSEAEDVTELIRLHVNENARHRTNQEEYQKRYNALAGRFESAQTHMLEIDERRQLLKVRKEMIEGFLETLRNQDLMVTGFNEKLWYALVEKVTVFSADNVLFTFKDGTTIIA